MKKYVEIFKEDLIVNLIMILGITITLSMVVMFSAIIIAMILG